MLNGEDYIDGLQTGPGKMVWPRWPELTLMALGALGPCMYDPGTALEALSPCMYDPETAQGSQGSQSFDY